MFEYATQIRCIYPFFYYMGRSAESSSSSYSTHSCSVLYKNSLCCILSPFWHIRQHTTSVCSHTAPEQQPQRCLQQQQRHHGCISSFSFFLPQDVISCWAGTSLSLLLKLATNWPSLAKQCTAAALNVKCVCVCVSVCTICVTGREREQYKQSRPIAVIHLLIKYNQTVVDTQSCSRWKHLSPLGVVFPAHPAVTVSSGRVRT